MASQCRLVIEGRVGAGACGDCPGDARTLREQPVGLVLRQTLCRAREGDLLECFPPVERPRRIRVPGQVVGLAAAVRGGDDHACVVHVLEQNDSAGQPAGVVARGQCERSRLPCCGRLCGRQPRGHKRQRLGGRFLELGQVCGRAPCQRPTVPPAHASPDVDDLRVRVIPGAADRRKQCLPECKGARRAVPAGVRRSRSTRRRLCQPPGRPPATVHAKGDAARRPLAGRTGTNMYASRGQRTAKASGVASMNGRW